MRRGDFSGLRRLSATHPSPPLCKGRCRAYARRRGCSRVRKASKSVILSKAKNLTARIFYYAHGGCRSVCCKILHCVQDDRNLQVGAPSVGADTIRPCRLAGSLQAGDQGSPLPGADSFPVTVGASLARPSVQTCELVQAGGWYPPLQTQRTDDLRFTPSPHPA